MQIIDNIPVWGTPQLNAVAQMANALKFEAVGGALMADHHLGYSVPVGGVIAYRNAVSPSAVGFDIACGNLAVLTDAVYSEVERDIKKIMDDVVHFISFGVGRVNNEKVGHSLFDSPTWDIPAVKALKHKAAAQLGTVGSGNHYVDLFRDERDRVWIGVHFGSRGFGHGIASHYIKAGGGADGINVDPVVLAADSGLGQEYIAAMTLAGQYAYAGREWVCHRVADLLGANILDSVHNHHNFAWEEIQRVKKWEEQPVRFPAQVERLWVVRKGATPAFPGQRGFVGGTMGEDSVILKGVASDEGDYNYYSTVHGAGRVMSRTQAAGKMRKGKRISEGCVSQEMMREWVVDRAHVELRGAGVDESPHCYKRLSEVLAEHSKSIEILHTLTPIGVAMAGANEFDPYKD